MAARAQRGEEGGGDGCSRPAENNRRAEQARGAGAAAGRADEKCAA